MQVATLEVAAICPSEISIEFKGLLYVIFRRTLQNSCDFCFLRVLLTLWNKEFLSISQTISCSRNSAPLTEMKN
jgi:hypothetical protein